MEHSAAIKAFDALVRNAEAVTASAELRKGQKPRYKAPKSELIARMEASNIQRRAKPAEDRMLIRQAIIGAAYPPSKQTLADLNPISTTDLRMEVHHRGSVLIFRACCRPTRMVAVQSVIEDTDGHADALAVYNVHHTVHENEVLPQGGIFALKELYYKMSADGSFWIRVDHPCDLVKLPPGHPLIPPQWRKQSRSQNAEQYKLDGNTAIKRKDHASAYQFYAKALDQSSDDDIDFRRDLFRNRAQASLMGGMFERALQDCQAALIPAEEQETSRARELNLKTLYRAGSAAYSLRDFSAAQEFFKRALILSNKDKDVQRELARTKFRLDEATICKYDFESMAKKQQHGIIRLDCADFILRTIVRQTNTRGRGLFATQDIAAGDIVLCEKAFEVAFKSDDSVDMYMLLNINTKRASLGSHAALLQSLIQKIGSNPAAAERYLSLHDGNYGGEAACTIIDDQPVVDTFQVQQISEMNRFGCHAGRSGSSSTEEKKGKVDFAESVGVWIRASYINHDCIGNATRTFLGDMMILRATRPIAKDEEILIPYKAPDADHATARQDTAYWGFTCACSLCTAEEAVEINQRRERKKLLQEKRDFLSANTSMTQRPPLKAAVSRGEQLYSRIARTYEPKLFNNVPRVGLLDLAQWLCQAYALREMHEKTLETARNLLMENGIQLTHSSGGWEIERRGGCSSVSGLDAAMYASHACSSQGDYGQSKAYHDLGKQLYLEQYGSLLGFAEI